MVKKILIIFCIAILFYTRFVNLSWGLPYPFHPDERNMADAIVRLSCDIPLKEIIQHPQNCFNPHFFAYGQLPLYISYIGIQIFHVFVGLVGLPISFSEAAIALRIIAAFSSVGLVFVLLEIIVLIESRIKRFQLWYFLLLLLFTFVPVSIQSSHFGTTESFLMLVESLIVLICTRYLKGFYKKSFLFVVYASLLIGIAVGTKISAGLYVIPILFSFLFRRNTMHFILFLCLAGIFAFLSSPHYLISFSDAQSALEYESAVATGLFQVFYTKQFLYTLPVIFPIINIFPFALGLPIVFSGIVGIFLSSNKKEFFMLKMCTILFFISNAFLFAKWTRFMAPVFPLLILFAGLGFFYTWKLFSHLLNKKRIIFSIFSFCFIGIYCFSILFGFSYLSIYQKDDVRITVSKWIYKNIPMGSTILSETANVVDLPVPPAESGNTTPNYQYIPFDFYNVQNDILLQKELSLLQNSSDYIFIPSRRVFANQTCTQRFEIQWGYNMNRCKRLQGENTVLQDYYETILGETGSFAKIAEFTSYPSISLFNKKIIEFPDEGAEETWSVFDHPVFRIYSRK